MDSSTIFQLIAVIILILLSAFFSSAETAMTTVNKIRVQSLASQGDKRSYNPGENHFQSSSQNAQHNPYRQQYCKYVRFCLDDHTHYSAFRKCICRYCYRNPDTANFRSSERSPQRIWPQFMQKSWHSPTHGLYIS